MLAYNALRLRRPLTSHILVTKHCNLDCKMCFVYPLDKKEKKEATPEPTLEQILYLIDESCRLGAQVIIPFGGEPLIRKDIGEIVRAIKRRGRFCILYTNGVFVEERLKDLKGVDQLVISIDGDERTNDAIRGKGVYQKAVGALRKAKDAGFICRIHTCLIPETIGTLDHMCALAKEFDCMLNYGYCDATALTKNAEDAIALRREDVIEFLKKYLEAKRSGVKISTPASVIKECLRLMELWPIESMTLSKKDAAKFKHLRIPGCALASSNIYIDSDGSVYPFLPLWGKEAKPPNVYTDGLSKAWQHYNGLDCHQCFSIFTIEKSLFYSFNIATILEYVSGYEFLK